MRVERERSKTGSRWLLQTTGAVDRALATLLVGGLLLVAHLLGVDFDILRHFWFRP